ncbi:MAG: hypothetical protein A3F72_00640 [Bacteroidetes bacterium RIFCSPLOWO2_12_FULL_35_15]|nr:MAG: hypothetical protein A3F72_00640 [Bacteroidetes bacterium RIFCSPLOWO2_12_FULL_35_15]
MDKYDFNFDDLSDEEKEEIEKEEKERRKAIKNSPLYLKALEIYNIVKVIVETLSEEDREIYGSTLLESAIILTPKIAGAMGSESWLLSMQNASVIRYHSEYLHTATSGLRIFTNTQKEYVQLLRTEMEEFRELFKDWVKTFNKLDREEYVDEWGLFVR